MCWHLISGEPDPKSAQIHHGNKFSPGMAVARHWIVPNLGEFGSTQNSRNAYRLLLNTLLMDSRENCTLWLCSNVIKWKREIHSVSNFFGKEENFPKGSNTSHCDLFVNTIGFGGLFSWITASSEFYKLNCVYEFMSFEYLWKTTNYLRASCGFGRNSSQGDVMGDWCTVHIQTNMSFYWGEQAALASLTTMTHQWIFTANLAVAEAFSMQWPDSQKWLSIKVLIHSVCFKESWWMDIILHFCRNNPWVFITSSRASQWPLL